MNSCVRTEMDTKLLELFDGECIHNNDSAHLNKNTPDDRACQDCCKSIIVCPLSLNDLPKGPVGRSLIKILSNELNGIFERKWNFARPICFISSAL